LNYSKNVLPEIVVPCGHDWKFSRIGLCAFLSDIESRDLLLEIMYLPLLTLGYTRVPLMELFSLSVNVHGPVTIGYSLNSGHMTVSSVQYVLPEPFPMQFNRYRDKCGWSLFASPRAK
jgi:hypothetical protein